MAEALVEKKASVKKQSVFGTPKEPDLIIYQLVKTNEKLRDDTPLFRPYVRFPNTNLITWKFDDGSVGTRAIRWLPGFGSIFVDEQEAGNRVIPDNVLNNPNNRFEVVDGQIKIRPHEKTKIQFLDMCNRNANSEYSTGIMEGLFVRYSEEKKVEDLSAKQKAIEEAIKKAFSADEGQVAFHSKYLGIALNDTVTGAARTYDAVVADYRQEAINNPVEFLKTFDDEDLKIKYKIENAVMDNFISRNIIKGKAVFSATKAEICDIAEGADLPTSVDIIFAYSQGKNGAAFLKQLADFDK